MYATTALFFAATLPVQVQRTRFVFQLYRELFVTSTLDRVHTAAECYSDFSPTGISGLILIEPTLITRELFNSHFEDRMAQMDFAMSVTSSRRDQWKSKTEALQYFQKRFPWNMWDPESLRLYVVCAFHFFSSDDIVGMTRRSGARYISVGERHGCSKV
jgi:hypothetical protein